MTKNHRPSASLHLFVTLVWLVVAFYLIFLYAPTEIAQGEVYRIIYLHVPCGLTSMVAYFLVFVGSVMFLWKRSPGADDLAAAAGEVGFIFCTSNLVSGSIWAKPIWGIWWTWDARLTLTFVLWLLFVSYLMLRSYVNDPVRGPLLAAVVGVIGFIDVPIDYMAIRWWRTQHPQPVLAGGEGSGMDPHMKLTLFVSWGAFLCLFFYLVRQRLWLAEIRRELSALRRILGSHAQEV